MIDQHAIQNRRRLIKFFANDLGFVLARAGGQAHVRIAGRLNAMTGVNHDNPTLTTTLAHRTFDLARLLSLQAQVSIQRHG